MKSATDISPNHPSPSAFRGKKTAFIFLFTILAICFMNFAGWLFEIPLFKSLLTTWMTMKPVTSLSFILTAIALIILQTGNLTKVNKTLVTFTGVFVALTGTLSVVAFILNLPGNQNLPVMSGILNFVIVPEKRMALVTAILFVLCGISLLLLAQKKTNTIAAAHGLMLAVLIASYFIPVSYLFGLTSMDPKHYTTVAFYSGINFCLLSLAIFLLYPGTWFMKVFTDQFTGGRMARRLVPGIIIIPLVIGWLRIHGERSGFFSSEIGIVLVVVAFTFCFLILVWSNANALINIDARQRSLGDTLRQSEEQYRQLVESANSMIMRLDADGTLKYVNDFTLSFFGYTREEMIGRNVMMIVPDKESTGRNLTKLIPDILTNSQKYPQHENENIRKNGERVWVSWTNRMIRDIKGNPLEILTIGNDITESKRSETKIKELLTLAERRSAELTAVIESIPDAVYIGSKEGITLCNTSALKMLGADSLKDLQNNIGDLGLRFNVRWPHTGQLLREDELQFSRALGGEIVIEEVLATNAQTGEDIYIRAADAPIIVNNEIIGAVAVNSNITAQKKTEEELRKSKKQYELLFNSIEEGFAHYKAVLDENGRLNDILVLDINPAGARLSGVNREEQVGKTWRQVWSGIEDSLFDIYREVYQKGETFIFEYFSGITKRWYTNRIYKVDDDQFAVTFIDITDRKKAEEEAVTKATQIEAVLGCIAEGVIVYDRKGHIIRSNTAADLMLKLNETEKAQTLKERVTQRYKVFSEDGRLMVPDEMPAMRASVYGETISNTVVLIETFGEPRWFSLSAAPLFIDGLHVGGVLSLSDVSQRKEVEKRLAYERELFEGIVENIPVMITITDPELQNFRLNKALKNTIGWTEEDVADGNLMTKVYPDPEYRQKVIDFMQSLTPGWMEWVMTAKNGTKIESSWANINLPNGVKIGIGIDIRQRKKAEAALRENEQRLQGMINNAAIGIVITDSNDRFIDVNNRLCEILGYAREELLGKTVSMLTAPEDRNLSDSMNLRLQQGEFPNFNYEKRYLKKDGSSLWVHVTVSSVRDLAGNHVNSIGTVEDISVRKEAEERVRESEQRLRLAVESANLGTWDLDLVNDVATRSLRHDQIWGYNELQQDWGFEIAMRNVFQDDRQLIMDAYEHGIKSGLLAHENRVHWPDGSIHWIRAYGRFSYNSEGRPVRVMGIVEDITERKQSEIALRESEARFKAILQVTSEGIIIFNPNGDVVYVNEAEAKINKYSSTEDMMRSLPYFGDIFELYEPDGRPVSYNEWPASKALRGESVRNLELRVHRKDIGQYWFFNFNAEPVFDSNHQLLQAVLFTRDVTQSKKAEEIIRQSREELKSITDNSPDVIARFDRDLRHTFINPYGEQVYGKSRDEIIGKTNAELGMPAGNVSFWETHFKEVFNSGKQHNFEFEFDSPNLGHQYFLSVFVPESNGTGETVSILAITRDITSLKRSEDALRQNEQRLRGMFNNAAIGIVEGDGQGYFIDANARACEILGYTKKELIGKHVSEITVPEDIERSNDINEKIFSGQLDKISYDKQYIRKDGKRVWVDITVSAVRDEQGRLLVTIGTIGDITERKQWEDDLKESEEMFSNMVNVLPIGLTLSTFPDRKIYKANPAWLNILGYTSEEEVIGKNSEELGLIRDLAHQKNYLNEFRQNEKIRNVETTIYTKAGTQRIALINLDQIYIKSQKYILATVEDVTEQKAMENELKQKNEELTRFIYTVSHDLKSPLVTIKSFTSYLKEDLSEGDKEAQNRDFSYIENAADKMGRLLEELLELSRIGKKENAKTEIPMKTVARSALDLVAGRISQGNVKIIISGPDVILYGHQQRLLQLYQNLIDNAVKFMGSQPEPQIEIGSYFDREEKQIVLFVKDNGSGIDPRYRDKVFGLFEKLDAKKEGTGIGLALIKRIVEIHGGTIWFTSEGEGKGTTFFFMLEKSTYPK